MPRRVEDIIPGSHRTIREVPVREVPVRRVSSAPPPLDYRPPKSPRDMPPKSPTKAHSRRGMKIALAVFGLAAIVGIAGYLASAYWSRAVFTIAPREIPVTVNNTVVITPTSVNGSLAYELVSFRDAASTTVAATTGAYAEIKAQGTATIYNSYSASAWRLIAGTRLLAGDGLIYRLGGTVSVPGFIRSSSGAVVPGTITAPVIADQPGEKYNRVRIDPPEILRVAAYAGNAKYDSIYAKITSSVKGGFAGNKVTVSPSTLASATTLLQANILARVLPKLKDAVPQGYILYDSAHFSAFEAAETGSAGANKATVTLRGIIYGILLKRSDLVPKLAGTAAVQSFDGFPYDTPGLDQLTFNVSNAKDFSPVKKNTLIVQIKGSMKLTGIVPVDELKSKFAGMALTDTQAIIRSYAPVIDLEKSSGQVVPPWAKIPANTEKISIIVQN